MMKRPPYLDYINAIMGKCLRFQLPTYAILLIGGLFGCTTPPVHLTPIVNRPNMDKVYFEGRALALSFGEKSTLAISGTIDGDELILLMLCVNHTERIDVIPEDISILAYSINNQRVFLKVYPPSEYMVKQRNAQEWDLALQALSGALGAQRAGRSTTITRGSYGGKSFVVKTETKDHDAVDRALEKQREELRETAEGYARINAATETGLLKAHTIFNNQAVGGIVMVKLLRPKAPAKNYVLHDDWNTPTGGYVPYSKVYSKIVITVPWVKEEPHQIILAR